MLQVTGISFVFCSKYTIFTPLSSPSTLMAKSISSISRFYDAWAKVHLERFVAPPPHLPLHKLPNAGISKVRVVQHKQTRELYALKYINKTKCVKMKAVPNVIQERRLLEEVGSPPPSSQIRLPNPLRSTTPLS